MNSLLAQLTDLIFAIQCYRNALMYYNTANSNPAGGQKESWSTVEIAKVHVADAVLVIFGIPIAPTPKRFASVRGHR